MKVRDDEAARSTARLLGARALAANQSIWLGPGASVDDVRLMGHEAAHVVQQAAPVAMPGPRGHQGLEASAREVGRQAASGAPAAWAHGPGRGVGSAPVGIQKDGGSTSEVLNVQLQPAPDGTDVIADGHVVATIRGAQPAEVRASGYRTASPGGEDRSLIVVGISYPLGADATFEYVDRAAFEALGIDLSVNADSYEPEPAEEPDRPIRGSVEGPFVERPLQLEGPFLDEGPAVPEERALQRAAEATHTLEPPNPPALERAETPAGPPPEQPRTVDASPPPISAYRADLQDRIAELEEELNRASFPPETLHEMNEERNRLLDELNQPLGPRDLTDDELEQEIRARRAELLDAEESSESMERSRRELEGLEQVAHERNPPPSRPEPPPPDPQVQRLLRRVREGRWDVDDLAEELSDSQIAGLSLADRVALIRAIASGTVVMNDDERTILRLLRGTPESDMPGLLERLDANNAELLDTLESALDFDDYKEYHQLLASMRMQGRNPADLVRELREAPALVWSDPGLIRGTYTPRTYIESAEITDEGRVRVVMWHTFLIAGIEYEPIEFDPMQIVQVHFPIGEEAFGAAEGQVMYVPAIALLALENKQFKEELMLAADVAGIAAGGLGVVTATTRLARAIAVAETMFAAADIAVRDYQSAIGQTPAGRRFLSVWSVAQVAVGLYGIGRAALEAPEAFRSLRAALAELRGSRHGLSADDLAALEREVEALSDQVDEVRRVASSPDAPDVTPPRGSAEGPAPEVRAAEDAVPPTRQDPRGAAEGPDGPPRGPGDPPGGSGEPPSRGDGGADRPPAGHRGATADADGVTWHPPMRDPPEVRRRPVPGADPDVGLPPSGHRGATADADGVTWHPPMRDPPEVRRGRGPDPDATPPVPQTTSPPPGPASSRVVNLDDLTDAQRAALETAHRLPSLSRLSDGTVLWLLEKGLFTPRARRSLTSASDRTMRAIDRFAGESGFKAVMDDWLKSRTGFQVGARWVLHAGYDLFGDLPPGSIIFEGVLARAEGVGGGLGRQIRRTDVMAQTADGMLWEFKSVSSLSSGALRQMTTDLVLIAADHGPDAVSQIRWVFDRRKMQAAGLTEAMLIERFSAHAEGVLSALPRPYVQSILNALEDIVVFYP